MKVVHFIFAVTGSLILLCLFFYGIAGFVTNTLAPAVMVAEHFSKDTTKAYTTVIYVCSICGYVGIVAGYLYYLYLYVRA